MASCTPNIINPSTSCNKPEGMIKQVIFAKESVSFADITAALLKAGWDSLIQSKAIIPLPVAMSTEPMNEGAIYEQTPLGSTFVRDGRMELKVNIEANLDLHSKIRTLNTGNYNKVFLVYTSGVILATKQPSSDILYPLGLQMMHVEPQVLNDGAVTSKTPIHLTFDDLKEFNDYPALIVPTWNPLRLSALKNVQLKVISANATTIVVDAYIPHVNSEFKNPVEGLVSADFLSTTAAGVVETIGSVAPDTNVLGRYTITGTGLVTGFIDLKLPSLMTTKGFESTGKVVKTIA